VVTGYLWDRRGRLSGIDRNADGDSADVGETTYTSDSTGIRTTQSTRTSTTATSTTAYLNDPSNPTGHAKAAEEWVNGTLTRSYTFGRSVLSQTGLNGERGVTEILYLLTDPGGSTRSLVGSAGTHVSASYSYDAFGEALGFDPGTARTPWLFGGDGLHDPASGWTYHLARYRDGHTFTGRDPVIWGVGDLSDANLYRYAASNPVVGRDPTGMFSMAQGLAVGAILGGFAYVGLKMNFLFGRNTSGWTTPKGQFIPVDRQQLEGMYHSVRIRGSRWTVDEMFDRMANFAERDMRPVRATGNVAGHGTEVAFDMVQGFSPSGWQRELGQGDFNVRVTRYDRANRYFVVRTLSGHPLAGWRRWQISKLPDGDLLVETFSIEHPATNMDRLKMNRLGGNAGMRETWTNFLADLVRTSGGHATHDQGNAASGRWFSRQEVIARLPMVEGGDR
jgi:RHS repeat-associated protein